MIKFRKHSGIYTLKVQQDLPITVGEAWNFFATPINLSKITPAFMGFKITSEVDESMRPGQIITYKVGIVPGIMSNWVTEITHVVEGRSFVDEQRFGPYAMWHHEHLLEKTEGGTRVIDIVSYKVPYGPIGRLLHFLFIKKQLKQIFSFRYEALNRLFA